MNPWLLLFLIIIANLVLYWVFFGQKRMERKFSKEAENERKLPRD